MKKHLFLFFAAALTLGAAPNQIENGSFEEDKCPFTWRPRETVVKNAKLSDTPNRFISRSDTTRVHSGKRSWYHECASPPAKTICASAI